VFGLLGDAYREILLVIVISLLIGLFPSPHKTTDRQRFETKKLQKFYSVTPRKSKPQDLKPKKQTLYSKFSGYIRSIKKMYRKLGHTWMKSFYPEKGVKQVYFQRISRLLREKERRLRDNQ